MNISFDLPNNSILHNTDTNTSIINNIISLYKHLAKTNCNINVVETIFSKLIKFIKKDEEIISEFINDIILKQAKKCAISIPMIDDYFEEMNEIIQKTNSIVDFNCSMTSNQLQVENKILKDNLYNEIDINEKLFTEMINLKHQLIVCERSNSKNQEYDFLLSEEYQWKRDFLLQISVNKELMKKMHITLTNKNLAIKDDIDFYYDMYCIKMNTNPYLERFKSKNTKETIELSLDIIQNNIINDPEFSEDFKKMRGNFHNELSKPIRDMHNVYDNISLRIDKTLDKSNEFIKERVEKKYNVKLKTNKLIRHKKVNKYVTPIKGTYKNYGFITGIIKGFSSIRNDNLDLKNTEIYDLLKNRNKWKKDMIKMEFIKSRKDEMVLINNLYKKLSREMKNLKKEKSRKTRKIEKTCRLLKTRKIDDYVEYNNIMQYGY